MTITFGEDRLCPYGPCEACGQTGLVFRAHARRTDPETSHAAARSVTRIRESQKYVLSVLKHYGPHTDESIWDYYVNGFYNVGTPRPPQMSPSGARTRRNELVAMGKIKDSGRREKLVSGRNAVVWMAVE